VPAAGGLHSYLQVGEALLVTTVAEAHAAGRAARKVAPRSAQAGYDPPAGRDPIAVLERQAETRVAALVPIRYGRMLVSPFAFYRGAAAIMAADLAPAPRSGLTVQLCGDAHLSNFGAYGSPERRLVFDLNDFDETLPGPWEWDVKRLVASFAVAAREHGLPAGRREEIVREAAERYRTAMREFAGMRTIDVWYARLDVQRLLEQLGPSLGRRKRSRAEHGIAKAHTRDSTRAYSKLIHMVDGEPRIISDPPLIIPVEELAPGEEASRLAHAFLHGYARTLEPGRRALLEQYRFVHLAHKVVGVGSVGLQAWIALFLGRDDADPLFLQVKQAQASALEEHIGRSAYRNHGARVVAGQRVMQAASDILLGWRRINGLDFYARQLKDWKTSVDVDEMSRKELRAYAQLCGWTLARAHARSGDRIALAAYLGGGDAFDRAMAGFAEAYADQNERDYAALKAAVGEGRLTAAEL
jgi:uncharacterized protein (DUF2252 family)